MRVPGRENVADARWNVGLDPEGVSEPPGDLELLKAGLTNMIGGQTLEAEKVSNPRTRTRTRSRTLIPSPGPNPHLQP